MSLLGDVGMDFALRKSENGIDGWDILHGSGWGVNDAFFDTFSLVAPFFHPCYHCPTSQTSTISDFSPKADR